MGLLNRKRRNMRIKQGLPVIIKDDRTEYKYPATMFKCGKGMLFLKANYAPQPGSKFHIILGREEHDVGFRIRPAMIEWRKLFCKSNYPWSYLLRIKYI